MPWWEESWYARNEDKKKTKQIHCPVCREYLGEQSEGTLFITHCPECLATFTFYPSDSKPSVILDCQKKKECGCFSCRPPDPPKEVLLDNLDDFGDEFV